MSNRWSTRVLEHDFLAADVRRLILEKPEQIPNFYAGQYLQLIVDDQRFPFSIASAPQTNQLELHIKPTEGSADSLMVEQYLNEKPASVDFTYPHGNCYVDGVPERSVILIAAATGVTQMRSIARLAARAARSANRILVLGHINSGGTLSFRRTREPRCQRPPLSVLSCCQPRRQRLAAEDKGSWSMRRLRTAKTYLAPTFIYPAVQPWFMGPLTAS